MDPFNSMFRENPFGQMDNIFNSMLNDPFFGGMGMNMGAFHQNYQHVNQQQRNVQQLSHSQSAPVIEEVNDDDQSGRPTPSHLKQQPIVEEPDEDAPQGDRRQKPRTSYQNQGQSGVYSNQHSNGGYGRQTQYQPQQNNGLMSTYLNPFNIDSFILGSGFGSLMNSAMSSSNGHGYAFSSSSYTSVGPNGQTYSSSSTTKMGSGGVRETQACVRDGRSGQQEVTISRGINERERTVTRRRSRSGREEQIENLKNLGAGEGEQFEDEWLQHAERNLPINLFDTGAVRSAGQRQGSRQAPLALPAAPHGAGGYGVSARPPAQSGQSRGSGGSRRH